MRSAWQPAEAIMKRGFRRMLRLMPPALAIVAFASASSAALAARGDAAHDSSKGSGIYYSESMGVKTPNEHITGSTSSRDAQGAPIRQEQELLDEVMTALVDNPQLKGADLHVNVEKNRVGLTGHAKDAAQARYARDAVQAAAADAVVDSQVTAG
jgi:hypothetical protein